MMSCDNFTRGRVNGCRTHQRMDDALADASFQAAQFGGMAGAMQDQNHNHFRRVIGEGGLGFPAKNSTDTLLLGIVPADCIVQFSFHVWLKNDRKHHCLSRYGFSISAKTSSMGRPFSGCARASAARRSSSVTCSGGSRRICSGISTALMPLTYRVCPAVQARFSAGMNSSCLPQRSAFSGA